MKKKNIIIIEATSSGINYIPEANELGYNPVCVELYCDEEERGFQRFLHDMQYSLVTDEKPDILFADESYEKTLEAIRELDPILIIPGADSGIIWANKMSYELGLPCNNPKLLKKMTNKRCMQESLKKADLRYIKSQPINTFEEAKEFMAKNGLTKVVIKPSVGQATVGMRICETDEELKEAITTNKSIDLLGNDEILIQEYIGGEEYVVDSVSCNGTNRITALYKYSYIQEEREFKKRDYMMTVADDDPLIEEIIEYHKKVIPAIGIGNGAIHAEYKIDSKGPALIEVNCRLNGGMQIYSIENETWGESHAGAALEAYLNLDIFHEKLKRKPNLRHHYARKYLIMPEDCYVLKSHVNEFFRDLESLNIAIEFGGERFYPKTIDLSTCGGIIHLTHESRNRIMEDVNYIKKIERDHIEKIFTIKK